MCSHLKLFDTPGDWWSVDQTHFLLISQNLLDRLSQYQSKVC